MERRFKRGSMNDGASRGFSRAAQRFVAPAESVCLPFVESLGEPEQKRHTVEYMTGLVSGLERKTGEGIAYLHDQERQGIQKFIGFVPWDHQPLLATLASQVGQELGEADGVIVFDPSGFPKKGTKSVGVGKQWCGRLGKVENCQVGVYMGYVTRKEHAIVNVRLYLPEDWAKDSAIAGSWCTQDDQISDSPSTGVGDVQRARRGFAAQLDRGRRWLGSPSAFRLDLRTLGERYLLAVIRTR